MALPPTKLKDLLYACRDADAVFDELVAARCLSRRASVDREGMRALVSAVSRDSAEPLGGVSDACGPNHVDVLSDALEEAGVLSRRGRRWASETS